MKILNLLFYRKSRGRQLFLSCRFRTVSSPTKTVQDEKKETFSFVLERRNLSFDPHCFTCSVSTMWGEWANPGAPLADGPPEGSSQMPFMDHWNVSHPHISLRAIIKEEQALHDNMEKVMQHARCWEHTEIFSLERILNWSPGDQRLCANVLPTSRKHIFW